MYCKNCGKEIDDNASICVYCGVATGKPMQEQKSETNVLSIVGFILSFFIPIAGLICSIIGYRKSAELGGKGRGLGLAGIIISAISMAVILLYVIIVFAFVGGAVAGTVAAI